MPFAPFIPGLMFLAFGLVVLVICARSYDRGRAARRWPTTTGVIHSSSVLELGAGRGSFRYAPLVHYRYSVGGHEHEGTRIRVGGPPVDGSHDEAQRLVEAHPAGAEVRVYYHPTRPQEAVLQPGSHRRVLGGVILGAVFTLLGGAYIALIFAVMTRSP